MARRSNSADCANPTRARFHAALFQIHAARGVPVDPPGCRTHRPSIPLQFPGLDSEQLARLQQHLQCHSIERKTKSYDAIHRRIEFAKCGARLRGLGLLAPACGAPNPAAAEWLTAL